jgi:hypothetical protein
MGAIGWVRGGEYERVVAEVVTEEGKEGGVHLCAEEVEGLAGGGRAER